METAVSIAPVAVPEAVIARADVSPVLSAVKSDPKPVRQPKVSESSIKSMVKELNTAVKMFNTNLSFSVDKDTGKTVIKVIDTETKEIIRQIPPEDALRVAAHIKELVGILYDHKR